MLMLPPNRFSNIGWSADIHLPHLGEMKVNLTFQETFRNIRPALINQLCSMAVDSVSFTCSIKWVSRVMQSMTHGGGGSSIALTVSQQLLNIA